MKLSELCQQHPELSLLRDGSFDALGMMTTRFESEQVLSFIEHQKYTPQLLQNPNITALICTPELLPEIPLPEHIGVVLAEQPRYEFYRIHAKLVEQEFYWKHFENEIHPSAQIHPSAVLYDHSIAIGEGCIIEANVVIHPGTIMGKHCIVRSGSQIGTSGFQFLNTGEAVLSVPSGGRVIFGDYVEIQHLSCVDKGVFGGDTVLKDHVKVDNLVQIAHDNVIGERTLIVSGTQFGGRVQTGSDGWFGINATVSNGLTIGEGAKVSLGAVVTQDVPEHTRVSGNFAIDHTKFLKQLKKIR